MLDSNIDWTTSYASRISRIGASEIRELLKLTNQPEIISFAGGLPDPGLFPVELIGKAYREALSDTSVARQALQYSVSEGYAPLRQWLVAYMATQGVACDLDNIVITSGSQQGLDFLGKLFLTPGDTALMTAPTYLGALQALSAYEPRFDAFDSTGENKPARQFEEDAAGGRIKLAYLVPDFANPTGETVTRQSRTQILDLAAALNIPVIEDAAYTALRYDGAFIPPVLALDIARTGSINSSRTIYCGTFSKIFAPSLRIGWICAARTVVEKAVLLKQASDLHSSTINQIVMHQLAEQSYAAQIEKIRRVYRERRDHMLRALEKHMPQTVSWTRPEGGMFIWLTLASHINGNLLLKRAIEEEKVAFVPGAAFFHDRRGENTIRLSYSLPSFDEIDDGIGRLANLIRRMPAGSHS